MKQKNQLSILKIYFSMNEKRLNEREIKIIWKNVCKKIRVSKFNSFFFQENKCRDFNEDSIIKFKGIYLN